MALKQNITLKGRHIVDSELGRITLGKSEVDMDMTIRVISVNGRRDQVTAYVQYLSSEGYMLERTFDFVPNMDGDNFIKQAYLYLKTLPEFEGAEDV